MIGMRASSAVECGLDHICGVMIGMRASSAVECGFDHWSGQIRNCKKLLSANSHQRSWHDWIWGKPLFINFFLSYIYNYLNYVKNYSIKNAWMWFFYGRLIGSFISLYGRQGFPTKKKSQFLLFVYCSAWLRGDDDLVISRINNRIGAVTGLDMNTAEDLQVYLTFNNIWVISSCLYKQIIHIIEVNK
jgi:hypothetical protein